MKLRLLLLLFVLCNISLRADNRKQAVEFIRNEGQWPQPFLFHVKTGAINAFLERNGVTYVVGALDNYQKIHDFKHNLTSNSPILHFHAYRVFFENCLQSTPIATQFEPYYYNYFLGNNPATWRSNVHPAQIVNIPSIYPGVDVRYSSDNGNLKYDFIVAAGADPSLISLRYEGANQLLLKNNKLIIVTSVGTIEEVEPYVYQMIAGRKLTVPCRYVLSSNRVSFHFPQGYDSNLPLIIDPTVVFATYTGSTFDNWGFTATYDNQGNFYAGGIAGSGSGGTGYPTTLGAFQTTFGGGGNGGGNGLSMPSDMAITKYNAAGTAMIYSTYIGGSDNDQPHSMVVDDAGNLIIAGRTFSSNFPTTAGCFDNTHNDSADIVVVKLNASGSTLIGATYVGGSRNDGVNISSIYSNTTSLKHNYGDDARSEVIVDNQGDIYVAASSQSPDFPITGNAFQSSLNSFQDGVVFKLDPLLTTLTWSTFLGGNGNDAAYVLALNTTQSHLYVGGGTTSVNFPTTPGGLMPAYMGGSADGFIVKFQNGGNYSFTRGTFMGQAAYDQVYGVQVDKDNFVYSMGQTTGGTFPVSAGVFSNPGSSQFIIKLDSNLSTSIYSTVFGSGNTSAANISPVAFLVDTCEQVYISGWGGPLANPGSSTVGMPITPDAAQPTTDGSDFYFMVLSQNAQNLLYGTYMGSPTLGEHVDGGTSRFNKNGEIYQAICGGCGGSSSFPTTPGSWSQTNGSNNCNLVSLKIAFEFVLKAKASVAPDSSGCAPFTVQFQNGSTYAQNYFWDFGDGTTSTDTIPPPKTYTNPGVYHIKLVAANVNACNTTGDTAFLTVVVDTNSINASFNYTPIDSCGPFIASFTNTSSESAMPGSSAWTKYIWKFGDGTIFIGKNPPQHTYAAPGIYTVTLVMEDTAACEPLDSAQVTVTMAANFVSAAFNAPDSLCLNEGIVFANASTNATSVLWQFGDGNSSSASSPVYTFAAPGTFNVLLIAKNPATCNKIDSAYRSITIKSPPKADFTFAPIIPVPNKPIDFTNQSINATTYRWDFGDFNGSTEVNPSHSYRKTGRYKVCLEARNSSGCVDSICKFVDAEILVAIDVPTGFTPNGDGSNDILYVRGTAVASMNFKVYNRWGQLVFESDNLDKGWDGTFNGKPHEMDAFAWTLVATFIDGTSVSKTGNVTLMR